MALAVFLTFRALLAAEAGSPWRAWSMRLALLVAVNPQDDSSVVWGPEHMVG